LRSNRIEARIEARFEVSDFPRYAAYGSYSG